MNSLRGIKFLFLVVIIGMLCMACETTHQARSVKTSGFLDDYAKLKEGKDGQALMVYVDETANFGMYDSIIIEPVRLIATQDSEMGKIPEKDLKTIVNYFHAALNKRLAKDYKIVKGPGPKTLRLKVALTDMAGSKVVLDTLSAVVPFGVVFNAISKVATGNNLSVGSATGEIELLDSTTGKRLAAAVDSRGGTKYTGKFDRWDKWKDTQDACDHWTERVAARLAELSGS